MQLISNVGKTHEARCIQLSGFDLTHFFYLSVSLVCRALRDVHFVPALSHVLCYGRFRTPNRGSGFIWFVGLLCIQSFVGYSNHPMDWTSDTTWLVIILKFLEVAEVFCYFNLVSRCQSSVTLSSKILGAFQNGLRR